MKSKITCYVNGIVSDVKIFKFSGGEYQISLSPTVVDLSKPVVVVLRAFLMDGCVMPLALTVDAVRRLYGNVNIDLKMPYLPYARQDRVMNTGESLAVKVFCDAINSLNLNSVEVHDCHSDVGTALLNNCISIPQYIPGTYLYRGTENKPDALVSPDAGALKKVYQLAKSHEISEIIRADKTRSVKDGSITGTVVYGSVKGMKLLICDDICDGGMTFLKLGEELRKQGADKLYLHITHGIFSKGKDELRKVFDIVTCDYDYEEMFR